MTAPLPQESVASLRLPVPFFDLLMVLLVTCLVFVAPVRPDQDIRAMELPVAQGGAAGSASALMPVAPRRAGEGWNFEILGEGQAIAPAALAARASAENRKVILVVPPATSVQDFIAIQAVLTQLKVPFALAVQHKETAP